MYAYELEPLDPLILSDVIDEAIRSVINVELFNTTIQKENQDRIYLAEKQLLVRQFFDSIEAGEDFEFLMERAASGQFHEELPDPATLGIRRGLCNDFLKAVHTDGLWTFLKDLKTSNKI